VEEIVPDLIKDCSIPAAPDPIWEDENYDPLLMPPPIGCPEFEFSVTTSMKVGLEDPIFSVKFSPQPDSGEDNCYPFLSYLLVVPELIIECPSFEPTVTAGVGTTGTAELSVTQAEQENPSANPPDCDFDIDLDITFPCTTTSITMAGSAEFNTTEDAPEVTADATATNDSTGDTCTTDIDISFDLDLPCPEYEVTGTPTVTTGYDGASATGDASADYTSSTADKCQGTLDFSFDLTLPCTSLAAGDGNNTVTFVEAGGTLNGTATPDITYDTELTDKCTGDLAIDLELDIPCPTIEVGTATIDTVDIDGTPTLTYTDTPDNTADQCKVTFDLDINVPKLDGVQTSTTGSGDVVTDATLELTNNILILTVTKGDVQAKYC